jgi:hypothetical protein
MFGVNRRIRQYTPSASPAASAAPNSRLDHSLVKWRECTESVAARQGAQHVGGQLSANTIRRNRHALVTIAAVPIGQKATAAW